MHPVKEFYSKTLRNLFPPIRFAFAYGSAVFQQHGRPKGKMLDMVFAVDDALLWHSENLERHRKHYSFLKYLGPSVITAIQQYPAGVYYNTLVKLDFQVMKYGVISVKDLCEDLVNWRWLYIGGRLHKPVIFLTDLDSEDGTLRLADALNYNIKSAATCGALLLGEGEFTDVDLYTTIANLSYRGDFRMYVGEDKKKVHNIVKANLPSFQKLYEPVLLDLVETRGDGRIMKKRSEVSLDRFQKDMPLCVRSHLEKGKSLQQALSSLVLSSSIQQSVKGIMTAGVKKTVVYSFEKLWKMAQSMRIG